MTTPDLGGLGRGDFLRLRLSVIDLNMHASSVHFLKSINTQVAPKQLVEILTNCGVNGSAKYDRIPYCPHFVATIGFDETFHLSVLDYLSEESVNPFIGQFVPLFGLIIQRHQSG